MSRLQLSHEQEKLSLEASDIRIYHYPDNTALPIIHCIGEGLNGPIKVKHMIYHMTPEQLEASADMQSI
jgi:hypothetical protein